MIMTNSEYTLRLSNCLFVGCVHSPRSHSIYAPEDWLRGSCLSPEASLWLGKFVPDEFVISLPTRCILKFIGYRLFTYPLQYKEIHRINVSQKAADN
ncbi:hypothetical protein Xinn_03529 [Xenorhabdus innexi]|uniref:Uncharacterized protein n=1 Tax=Xenorhabdus innexi TaxID=290109 RepID=A0A2G0N5Z5_9GAMM|nr:hypothetical protein Xinn_03529 [Xenorhabdus innexi]